MTSGDPDESSVFPSIGADLDIKDISVVRSCNGDGRLLQIVRHYPDFLLVDI